MDMRRGKGWSAGTVHQRRNGASYGGARNVFGPPPARHATRVEFMLRRGYVTAAELVKFFTKSEPFRDRRDCLPADPSPPGLRRLQRGVARGAVAPRGAP